MLGEEIYRVRIIEGSLLDLEVLNDSPFSFGKKFDNPVWGRVIHAELSLAKIREVQKRMIKHVNDLSPWYMDGFLVEEPDIVICAFGIDDEEGGRIFIFKRSDREAYLECKQYGIAQGIDEDKMDFLE